MRSDRILWTAFFFFALTATGWAAEPGELRGGEARTGAVAVDCAGSYLRIDVDGEAPRIAARGHVWEGPGADALRPAATGRFDGCLVADAVGDPAGRFLYVAVAREPFFGRDGTRGYRVASLRLPDLELVSFVELDGVSDGPVSLLLSPGGGELLVSYSEGRPTELEGEPGPRFLRLPAPDVGSALVLSTKGQRGVKASPVENAVSAAARWVGEGRIVDGPRVLDERGEVLRRVDPYVAFGAWATGAFPGLVRKGAGGRPFLPIAFADSAADRMVFVVNPDWKTANDAHEGGLVVLDLVSGKTVAIPVDDRPAALDPASRGTPTVHLTPGGERVVVEAHELRRRSVEEREERFKTGTLRVYDTVSGRLSRTVSLGAAPGFSARVLGFSGDGRLLFYGSRETVLVVDLEEGEVLARLEAGPRFDPYWVVSLVPCGSRP